MSVNSAHPDELSVHLAEKYEILHALGHGTYGTVLKAIQRSTGQPVAVKVQHLDPIQDGRQRAVTLARFEREAQLCAALTHPHIVRVIDKGQVASYVFIIFEFVPGETLGQLLAKGGAMAPFDAVALMLQVLDAVSAAHSEGIVHRDLKPDNIMVVRAGSQRHVKVLDFGVGTFIEGASTASEILTRSEDVLGTPSYSAPEQLRGEPATPKSDIYAWGLVLLECLTGQRVMSGATVAQVFQRQLSPIEIPLPPALSAHALGGLVRRAIAKSPRDRADDARGLWRELQRLRVADLVVPPAMGPPGKAVRTQSMDRADFSGEQRQVTAFCCSLNIVSMTERPLDAETSNAIHRDQLTLCADVASRFGGHVVGTLANRLVAVFGWPNASDGDARRAARAALELATRIESRRTILAAQRGIDLELRIGLHTGPVIVDPDASISGPALNTASRLESLAKPGSTLVSEATFRLLSKQLQFRPAQETLHSTASRALRLYSLLSEGMNEALHSFADSSVRPELLGRDRELGGLIEHWEAARRGNGRVVLLRGEAGVGKSRLANELRTRALGDLAEVLEGQCLEEDSTTALYPVLTMLRRHFEINCAPGQSMLSRLGTALSTCGFDPDELMPVFCSWLAVPEVRDYPPLQISGERQRELLLRATAKLLCAGSSNQGGLVLLEDLQWADPTTFDLVGRLPASAAQSSALIVLTARPEIANWAEGVEIVDLHGLDRAASERLVLQCAGVAHPEREVVRDIVERTDGVPLFIEELTRNVLAESDEGSASTSRSGHEPIPTSLRDLLHSRLDRLGHAKEAAQVAAAIGREFDAELLAAVSLRTMDALQADLEALSAAQLIRRQRQSSGMKYVFRHALIRDAAWNSMLSAQRRAVHQRIADELEQRRGGEAGAEPARLARHYEFAGVATKAIEHRLIAARRAAQSSSYREAIEHLNAGLDSLSNVSDSGERISHEIDLRNALGGLLIATQGHATPAVIECFSRARDLLKSSAPSAEQRFATLKGLWTFHNARANFAVAAEIAQDLLLLAAELGRAEFHLGARECACQTALLTGQFEASVEHSQECEKWFDPKLQRKLIAAYGDDPWLVSLSFECNANTLLGKIDRARDRSALLRRMIEDLGMPDVLASMTGQVAWMELLIGSCGVFPNAALELCNQHARKAVEIAAQFGFPFWEYYGRLIIAVSACLEGDESGIRELEQSIESWRLWGLTALLGWLFSFLALGKRARGDFHTALSSAVKAVEHCDRLGEGYSAAEAHRVLGVVVGDAANPERDAERAINEFRKALRTARDQNAHWLELRAAFSFAEQTLAEGNEEAREELVRALEWFRRENFALDTPLFTASVQLLR